ncbi:MAG: mitochondrial fission ELM1 family protein [Hydrogenophilus sp.]|nr:mitochondrial fission ELM1 family protein [Hydrogenophilus sp.]
MPLPNSSLPLLTPAAPHWHRYRATADPALLRHLLPYGRCSPPLWVLTSGEAGMRAQALGLAETLRLPYLEWTLSLAQPWRAAPPALTLSLWSLLPSPSSPLRFLAARLSQPPAFALPASPDDPALPPLTPAPSFALPAHLPPPLTAPPTLLIACGRRVIAPALFLQRHLPSAPPLLYLQDPRTLSHRFTLIIAPAHDPIVGPNVIKTPLALHRVTPSRLAAAARTWAPRWAHYPKPWWGLILGGPSRSLRWDETLARAAITHYLEQARAASATLFAATSRRTPPATAAWLTHAIARHLPTNPPPYLGQGENPYLAILALTERRAITSDSVSMLSETVAAPGESLRLLVGRPRPRLNRFHRLWDGHLPPPSAVLP